MQTKQLIRHERNTIRASLALLVAMVMTLFALAGVSMYAPQTAWADTEDSAQTTAVDDEAAAAADDQALEEETIEEEDVPLGAGPTASIAHNLQTILGLVVVFLVLIFAFQLYRENRGINAMRQRFK